jgi:hypothetical protein
MEAFQESDFETEREGMGGVEEFRSGSGRHSSERGFYVRILFIA